MKLRTIHLDIPRLHSAIVIVGKEDQQYCGDTNCRGQCNLPALFLRHPPSSKTGPAETEFKAHSSMVACGPVFQQRDRWVGQKIYINELMPELSPAVLFEMMWW